MPGTYTPTVKEIERLIGEMRRLAAEHARVVYWHEGPKGPVYVADSAPEGAGMQLLLRARREGLIVVSSSIGVLRWHLVEWFLKAETVTKHYPVTVIRGGRRVALTHRGGEPVTRPEIVARRSPNARQHLAMLGISWMADHWSLALEPMIPRELQT